MPVAEWAGIRLAQLFASTFELSGRWNGYYAHDKPYSRSVIELQGDTAAHLFDNWFDPIEVGIRERVREFIEALVRGELDGGACTPMVWEGLHE